jgi:hypothetical protein
MVTIREFADKNKLTVRIIQREGEYKGTPDQWYLIIETDSGKTAWLADGENRLSFYGRGRIPNEAIADFAMKTRGKTLGFLDMDKLIKVPEDLEQDDDVV